MAASQGGHSTQQQAGAGGSGGSGGSETGSMAGVGGTFEVPTGTAGISAGGSTPLPPDAAHCAYPAPPNPGFETPAFVRALRDPSCRFELGDPIPLELPPAPDSTLWEYSFSYDVNGDAVGDLFFRAEGATRERGRGPPIALMVSRLSEVGVAFEHVPCSVLDLAYGRTYPVDLDADRVVELLVGTSDGLAVALNSREAIWTVIEQSFSEPVHSSTLDLRVLDFNGDGSLDFATSYDRAVGSDAFERGVELWVSAPELWVPGRQWSFGSGLNRPFFLSFTAVGLPEGKAGLLLLEHDPTNRAAAGRLVFIDETGALTERSFELVPPPSSDDRGYAAWAIQFQGRAAVAVLHERHLAFYDTHELALTGRAARFFTLETEVRHDLNNETGGGPEFTTRFMLDVDGDGDRDFVEGGIDKDRFLSFHRNQSDVDFGEPVKVDIDDRRNRKAPTPFVAIGRAEAALVVNDNGYEFDADLDPPRQLLPASVRPLRCAN